MRNVGASRDRAAGRARRSSWSSSTATASACRGSSRAASSSAWRWRAPSSSTRACCCSTSRSARSTASCARPMQLEVRRLQRRLGLTTHLHHPRPGGGAGPVRPHRGDEQGRDPAGRHDRPRSTSGRPTISSPTSSARATSSTARSTRGRASVTLERRPPPAWSPSGAPVGSAGRRADAARSASSLGGANQPSTGEVDGGGLSRRLAQAPARLRRRPGADRAPAGARPAAGDRQPHRVGIEPDAIHVF